LEPHLNPQIVSLMMRARMAINIRGCCLPSITTLIVDKVRINADYFFIRN
jgi:hypothetical protein